jgi:uncharacterized membrane protein YqiK
MTEYLKIDDLLLQAKTAFKSGDNSYQAGTEKMAEAHEMGATLKMIAEKVGKSESWVSRKLEWRKNGYPDTAFGPQSKKKRQRKKDLEAPQEGGQEPGTAHQQAQADAERARAATAKADAARAKAEAEKAKADARKAKADAAKARADAEKADAEARAAEANAKVRSGVFGHSFRRGMTGKPLPQDKRELLVKMLGMLGSDQLGERANAASLADKQRVELGMTWGDLIIPATLLSAKAA